METSPEPVAAAEAPRLRPGEQLRGARLRAGLDEPRAAAEMRIDLATLRALERDDYARLGAPIFVKGHLRNYARLLGLDAEALIAEYEASTRPSDPRLFGYRNEGESVDGAPIRQNLPLLNWLIALAIVAGVALWAHDNPMLQRLIEPQVAVTEGVVSAAPEESASSAQIPETAELAAMPAPAEVAAVETPVAEPMPPPEREAETDTAARPVATPGQLRVQLRFSGESWVEVYDAAGEPLVYELYDAGRSRSLSAPPPLRVFLGQAGAVTLTVDGRRLDLSGLTKRDGTARFTLAAGGELR